MVQTKLFSDLYLVKFSDISVKSFHVYFKIYAWYVYEKNLAF